MYHKLRAMTLSKWKGLLLTPGGRLVLLKSVLTAWPTYIMTIHELPRAVIKKIDRIRRGWLWRGVATANGEHCQANWAKVCRPFDHGGLGVLDLRAFGRALRLHWMWHRWVSPPKPCPQWRRQRPSSLDNCLGFPGLLG